MENDKFKQTGNLADESNGVLNPGRLPGKSPRLIVTQVVGLKVTCGTCIKMKPHPVNMARNESHNGIS